MTLDDVPASVDRDDEYRRHLAAERAEAAYELLLRDAAESVEATGAYWEGSWRQQEGHWSSVQRWSDRPRLHADRVVDGLVAEPEPRVPW